MADCSVNAQDESRESEASQALMICFDSISPEKSYFVVDLLCFAFHNSFCVRKCYQNRVKSSTVERVLFFISQFASGGKTNKGKEFMIAEGTV